MKRYRTLIVFLCLALGTAQRVRGVEFAGGTGEPNDPYQIATAEQLIDMTPLGSAVDGRVLRDLWRRHFVLTADIDLDPSLPGRHVFPGPMLSLTTGSLDGRGHKIVNLRIVADGGWTTGSSSVGADAIVRNVSFEQVAVEGESAILTSTNEGYIANCTVEGSACGVGLVLENRGHIMNCSVVAQAGGTCGLADKNSGSIVFSHVGPGLAQDGGLVRENSGAISDCYSTADVFGSSAAGGLVGTNSGGISRCYATGAVSVSASSDSHGCSAGGLVGENSGTISDCYALGATSATGSNYGHDYVGDAGGLAGTNTGLVFHCYAAGMGGAGLIGDPYYGVVLNSYFLSPGGGGGSGNGFGIPLTDLQMRRQGSFSGWDFRGSSLDGSGEIWTMPQEGGYPVLAMIQEAAIDGSGTAEDPYLIESADQFLAISRDAGATYRLVNDIDLQGRSFAYPVIPIFWGRLDGDNHTVANATFTGAKDAGLFGILHRDAEIDNLKVAGVHVENAAESAAGLMGVLAVRNHGRIHDCSASADCGFRGISDTDYIGGLVAVNEVGGEIRRCSVSWAAMGKFGRGGMTYWGGIGGHNLGSIAECHASALVGGEIARCAALVGLNDGIVVDCYADGYSAVAGLVYSNHAEVTNCYAAVIVPSAKGRGGLVSENAGGTITNSYFLAEADGGGPDNGLGVALSDAQMRLQASFSGWDFDEIWMLPAGDGYPHLRWEETCEP